MAWALLGRGPQRLMASMAEEEEEEMRQTMKMAEEERRATAGLRNSSRRDAGTSRIAGRRTSGGEEGKSARGEQEHVERAETPRMQEDVQENDEQTERSDETRSSSHRIAGLAANEENSVLKGQIASKYAKFLALRDLQRISEEAAMRNMTSMFTVKSQEDVPALVAFLARREQQPKVVLVEAPRLDVETTLEVSGRVRMTARAGSKFLLRVMGPMIGLRLTTMSSQLVLEGIDMQINSSVRPACREIQVVSKPLVHPPSSGHAVKQQGFSSSSDQLPVCLSICQGTVACSRCSFSNANGDAVQVTSKGAVELDDCVIERCGRFGVVVQGEGRLLGSNVIMRSNGRSGCFAQGVNSSCEFSSSSFEHNLREGLMLQEGASALLESSSVLDNGEAGIRLASGSHCQLLSCVVAGNRRHGVFSWGAAGEQQAGEDAFLQMRGWRPMELGRRTSRLTRLRMQQVRLEGNGGDGVRAEGIASSCLLKSCQLLGNSTTGASACSGSSVCLLGCSVRGNRECGLSASGRGATLLCSQVDIAESNIGVLCSAAKVELASSRCGKIRVKDYELTGGGEISWQAGDQLRGWMEQEGGAPPAGKEDMSWLKEVREKLATNSWRTWHGF